MTTQEVIDLVDRTSEYRREFLLEIIDFETLAFDLSELQKKAPKK